MRVYEPRGCRRVANGSVSRAHVIVLLCSVRAVGARYATILAFDVKVTADARIAAEEMGVRIFTADIIYHLTDQFDKYLKDSVRAMQEEKAADISFPCVCRIIPTAVFNSRNPIVVGMDVLEGTLRIGTPLCVLQEGKSDVRHAWGVVAAAARRFRDELSCAHCATFLIGWWPAVVVASFPTRTGHG